MSQNINHMECLNKSLEALHTSAKTDHIEHSTWQYKLTVWSTPYGNHGVNNITWPSPQYEDAKIFAKKSIPATSKLAGKSLA